MGIDIAVRIWEQNVVIPTYGIGEPEKNPIFLEKRVYQGSSGTVYPHPVVEKILDEKKDKTYTGLFLENQYLKIMILPELGGRVQMAYDKIRQRHFIYYNQVIKPALVGLTGPWISGGIEFNWPQHHRPSTFDPVDYAMEEHEDGSKTVWVSEVERMQCTKGMAGFRLYPDKAYLEVNVKLFNRTPFAQTFLWWANPAVKVNDHYQSVFPPDVHAVFDHGRRDVSEFPIAKGTYYKVDYSKGVDISRYKNIPVPTSYMAERSRYDFIGGYEHDTKAGMLHVADHHISPGKKQWTWGNGEFGHAWDKNLTDEDGPYVELMVGVFTDNQPDFSWISPYEERSFSQYFMPYSELGVVKNATKEAMINIDINGDEIYLKFYTTARYENATVRLMYNKKMIWQNTITISPSDPYAYKHQHAGDSNLFTVTLSSAEGKLLVSYTPEMAQEKTMPTPAKAPPAPQNISSIEQLYLTGLHIEQYRHATWQAIDYYGEALKREPGDVRCNNAMGLWLLKRGQFEQSESYFRRAVETLTERNPNPYDCESYYHLGMALQMQGKMDEAFDAYYRCVWNAPWQDAAYLQLTRLCLQKGNDDEALKLIEKSLIRNHHNQTARHLKCAILRRSGLSIQAIRLADESIKIDAFSMGCYYEKFLALTEQKEHEQADEVLLHIKRTMRSNLHHYIEYAFDYFHAGLYEEATNFLWLAIGNPHDTYPMLYYYLGYFAFKQNKLDTARTLCHKGGTMKPDYCFPNKMEDVNVLQFATSVNKDPKAHYYLGNYWYANRQHQQAITQWERSLSLDEQFPTVHRNLALAYHNKMGDATKALIELEKAFALNTKDGRVLMELDQLHKKLNTSPWQRLKLLEKHITLTEDRDDLYLERVTLYNQTGQYETAKALLAQRNFHPWEGGEGKVTSQFVFCHVALAKKYLFEEHYRKALHFLEQAEHYPQNLGEGKLYGTRENDIFYFKGCIYENMGDHEQAKTWFTNACEGSSDPGQAVFYNDQQPDKIFYIGTALRKLGHHEKAEAIFRKLIHYSIDHLNDTVQIDYFAVSLPDLLIFEQDLSLKNQLHCHYMMGLGYLGLGEYKKALEQFNRVLELDINHQGAWVHSQMCSDSDLIISKNLSQFANGELKHKP
jgi:tetratricopeptide (TPR) repeat protein